jgi:hypothetical protein
MEMSYLGLEQALREEPAVTIAAAVFSSTWSESSTVDKIASRYRNTNKNTQIGQRVLGSNLMRFGEMARVQWVTRLLLIVVVVRTMSSELVHSLTTVVHVLLTVE